MTTKHIKFGDNNYLEISPSLGKESKKNRYERKLREKNAVQELKKESFGLLKDNGIVTNKNTDLLEPIDITTIYNTWKNDYGGKRKRKRKTKKRKMVKKSRKSRKSRK
jgi:hypothetical protein